MVLRFANVTISKISFMGLVTIEAGENIRPLNEGKFIDKGLLNITYVSHSSENATMLSWNLTSYTNNSI